MSLELCGRAFLSLAIALGACQPIGSLAPLAAEPRRQIALTFDDAPRGDGAFFSAPDRARALTAALDEAGVEGVMFFVITGNIANSPDGDARLRSYAAAGHRLASHSHGHPSLRRTETAAFLADIDAASSILAAYPSVEPYFRYPFLHEGTTPEQRQEMDAALAARGLRNGYVTIDNYDWYMDALAAEAARSGREVDLEALRAAYVETLVGAVEFYDAIARDVLGRSPRHVLLLHENDLAAMFVDDLVHALNAAGWEIIPATEAFADPIAEIAPETSFNGQGRIAAIAAAAGRAPQDLIHESEDETFLRADFVRRGILSTADDDGA
jgi:peptidoglycan/xylan/chitin deacetylase (PgdA/CDA1 family)